MSELFDNQEKTAIFQHSMKHGLFNDIKNSPLKQKMPPRMQMYQPALDNHLFADEQRNLASQTFGGAEEHHEKPIGLHNRGKFIPRGAKTDFDGALPPGHLNDGLNYGGDFVFNPKKFWCSKHPGNEVEYVSAINGSFYCRKCAATQERHPEDKVLSTICYDLQKQLVALKNEYMKKKETLVKKLDSHQFKVESIFQIYYDTIDQIRTDMLEQEYRLRASMDRFETKTRRLVSDLSKFSTIEFYHEEKELQKEVAKLKEGLDEFNTYLPATQIVMKERAKAEQDIKVDLRERLNSYIARVDHSFALANYEYIMANVTDEHIKNIYRTLGPFDHFEHHEVDDEMDTQRTLRLDWDYRKSGAQYRGQSDMDSGKPDGIGFKIYPNNSMFEGYFDGGQINGVGRGITSRGEVYQGPFEYDSMHGEGLFQWPDGRLFYGNFNQGKKSGKGTYMWPNGQCYEGEFKVDECMGEGVLYYPDGKKFEGVWKDGKKHGTGVYSWPNGVRYYVHYIEGKQQGSGTLDSAGVSLEQLKLDYASLAKKSMINEKLMSAPPDMDENLAATLNR